MARTLALVPLVSLVALMGCRSPESPSTRPTTQEINGIEGMFEYALDLPWRMEPHPGRDRLYDPVPITISIHDEDTNAYSQYDPSGNSPEDQRLGEFCGISISNLDGAGEALGRQFHAWDELSWIEVTGPDPDDPSRPAYWPFASPKRPLHRVCHPGVEDCSALRVVRDSSEWQAQFMFDDPSAWPNAERTVELIAWVSRDRRTCAEDPDHWLALRTYARISYAADPLPRFDDGWLYGDLHYHSQSTDNEGESGYAYRAVATSLASMGVDFVFATDHASDSEQIVNLGQFGGEDRRGVRDLSQPRWDAALALLHGADGANHEGAVFAGKTPRFPRVFLGAEVDVMPEIRHKPADFSVAAWSVPYGNGLMWNMLGSEGLCEGRELDSITACPTMGFFEPFVDVHGDTAYTVKDIQGFNDTYVGRQHVLYVPRFRDTAGGLVASRTTSYGGASRHLIENNGVLDEIEAKHGLAFLAHPLAAGGGDKGPGMLPFTAYQYEKMFGHPALAGLQLWNEDTRVISNAGDFGQTGYSYLDVPWGAGFLYGGWIAGGYTLRPAHGVTSWMWSESRSPASRLHHGVAQWDVLLRWGLDLTRTQPIGWLEPGEPRKLFAAGGSDAHGDFNYRREGYMTGITKTTDTAIAKVRNLVHTGAPRGPCDASGKCYVRDASDPGHPQDQVAEALGDGRFTVTDGPALRIVIDRNRNGVIDDADYPMGSTIELYDNEQLPLLVEAVSTAEFGPLDRIDLYVGVDRAPISFCTGTQCSSEPADVRARTYGPTDHGVRGIHHDTTTDQDVADVAASSCGSGVCRMADGYWLPAGPTRDQLRITAAPGELRIQRPVTLDLDTLPTGGADPRPTRVYVRAFARTVAPCQAATVLGTFREGCAERYAYTNPIWTLRKRLVAGAECPFTDRALDRDLDGVPDLCDAFPDQPSGGSWTRVFGASGQHDSAAATAIDHQNNVWVAGAVRGTGRIEGATGANGSYVANGDDAIVAKYSPTGQLLGKLLLGGSGLQAVSDLVVRGEYVYVVGTSQGPTTIGAASWSSDSRDPFVARLRRSDLVVETTNRIAGGGAADGRAIAIGAGGQISVVGDFAGQLWALQPSSLAEGTSDCFIAYFADVTLQLQNVQIVRGAGSCRARDVVIDGSGRATAAYEYASTIFVSSAIQRTNSAGNDLVVVRYLPIANGFASSWGTFVGGLATVRFLGGDAWVGALALASDGSTYVGGSYTGNLQVWGTTWPGGQVTVQRALGMTDGYVLRLDGDGRLAATPNAQLSGADYEEVTGLAVDATGGLVIAGKHTSTAATFGTTTLARQSTFEDYVLAWLPPSGVMSRVRQMTASSVMRYGPLATSVSGDRAAFVSTLQGTATLDDRRTVQSADPFNYDGAVTLIPQPGVLSTAP